MAVPVARTGRALFRPGELLLINPDDPVDLTYSDDCEKLIVKLPASFLEQACSENQWRAPPVASGSVPIAMRSAKWTASTACLGLVCREAGSEQSIPQIQEQYSRIIASKLLCSGQQYPARSVR